MHPIKKAARILGRKKMADELGITVFGIDHMLRVNRINPRYVRKIEALTGIPAEQLCPEVFGGEKD